MIRALYSAASGMTAQQLNVDNIANNLANANTAGYKMRRAQFEDLIYQNMIQPGAAAGQQTTVPAGLQLGLGTRAASNEIIFTQGAFSQTNNPLDMVIQGKGFFQIRRPQESSLIRARAPFSSIETETLSTPTATPWSRRSRSPHSAEHYGRAGRDSKLYACQPNRRPKGRSDPTREFPESGRSERNRQPLYTATDASGDPQVGEPGGHGGLGSLCRATPSNRM